MGRGSNGGRENYMATLFDVVAIISSAPWTRHFYRTWRIAITMRPMHGTPVVCRRFGGVFDRKFASKAAD